MVTLKQLLWLSLHSKLCDFYRDAILSPMFPETRRIYSGVRSFNLEAKEVLDVDRLPKANKFGTNIIYFESENDQENNLTSVYKAIDMIIPALHDFCAKYKTICLVSSHIEEYTPDLTEIDEPHIHILFVKTSNLKGYDKLTDFLIE